MPHVGTSVAGSASYDSPFDLTVGPTDRAEATGYPTHASLSNSENAYMDAIRTYIAELEVRIAECDKWPNLDHGGYRALESQILQSVVDRLTEISKAENAGNTRT